jgi:hypothetical protein
MARTPEGAVKDKVKKILKDLDAWYYMPVQNGMGVVGIPDFVACINGRFVGIECKAPGKENTVTANQQRQIDGIIAAGGVALVISEPEKLSIALWQLNLI